MLASVLQMEALLLCFHFMNSCIASDSVFIILLDVANYRQSSLEAFAATAQYRTIASV